MRSLDLEQSRGTGGTNLEEGCDFSFVATRQLELCKTIDPCCLIHLLTTEIDRSSAANGTVALDNYDLLVLAHRLGDFVRHDQ